MNNNEPKNAVEQVIAQFSDQVKVINFLQKHGLASVFSICSVDRYQVDTNRQGVIVHAQERLRGTPISIIIDVKLGQPTTEQVFDAIYRIGKERSKRIIVFTRDENSMGHHNPTADQDAVSSVIAAMNLYPLDIHLFEVSLTREFTELRTDDLIDEQSGSRSIEELPSELRFRFEEFWSIYFDSNSGEAFYCPWEVFGDYIRRIRDWGFKLFLDRDRLFAEMPIYWNNIGINIKIKPTKHSYGEFAMLWNEEEEQIRSTINKPIKFTCLPGKLPMMQIQYNEIPVTWLLTATTDEKVEFANKLFEDLWDIRLYLEDVYETDVCKDAA